LFFPPFFFPFLLFQRGATCACVKAHAAFFSLLSFFPEDTSRRSQSAPPVRSPPPPPLFFFSSFFFFRKRVCCDVHFLAKTMLVTFVLPPFFFSAWSANRVERISWCEHALYIPPPFSSLPLKIGVMMVEVTHDAVLFFPLPFPFPFSFF